MIEPLLASWKDEVRLYRRRGQEDYASFLESLVNEAETFIDEHDTTTLSLADASAESGYSASHLGRLIREGRIPNAGRPNAPRIARKDLPTKPGQVASPTTNGQLDPLQIVRSVVEKE